MFGRDIEECSLLILFVGLTIIAFSAAGCASQSHAGGSSGGGAVETASAAPASAGFSPRRAVRQSNQSTDSASRSDKSKSESKDDRKIIKNAHLTLEVEHARKTVESIGALAGRFGGYVVRNADERITIRVEAERLEEAMEEIQKIRTVEELLDRRLTARDVTGQITDYDIRLENKLESRKRYLELMQKAHSVEGLLKIEKELERLNGEIERLKGRLKRLNEQVALAKISVRLKGGEDQRHTDTNDPPTYLSPGLSYSLFRLGGSGQRTLLHGPSLEIALLSYRDLLAENGPSHWRLFFELSILQHAEEEATPWGLWGGGLEMSLEGRPGREWLIPTLGFQAGQLFTPSLTVGHVTPSVGLYVWSSENVLVHLKGSYFLPPTALDSLRGWRAEAGVKFSFW